MLDRFIGAFLLAVGSVAGSVVDRFFFVRKNLDPGTTVGSGFKPDPDLDDPKPEYSIRIEQVSGFSDTRNRSGAQTKGFTPFFSSKEAFQV